MVTQNFGDTSLTKNKAGRWKSGPESTLQPSDRPGGSTIHLNQQIATALSEIGDLLEAQGANAFRVRAYREAAKTLKTMKQPVADILASKGVDGLMALPTIGQSMARLIEQFVRTGHLAMLERLRGDNLAEHTFATVAGIGPKLARLIHEELGIETLPELQAAAQDGRLATVPGMGARRIQAISESLAGRLRGSKPSVKFPESSDFEKAVPVAELLDVDREYRQLSAQKKLPLIAPRRFNPSGAAWLPVLHTVRDDRHYTALYSNTARAHQLNTTHDWVVVYRDDHQLHGRWTVITAQFGKLKGCRIIRGREDDCLVYYQQHRPHGV